jgi:hypothetical protein
VSFANIPVSLSEVRAEKEGDGKLWSPRDALVSILRDIDAGKVAPTDVVICYREDLDGGNSRTRFACAGKSGTLATLGMLARVSFMMQERD